MLTIEGGIYPAKRDLGLLNKCETEEEEVSETGRYCWHPEYGAWMFEGTPDAPYGGWTADLWRVEANMRVRPARLLMALGEDEISPTVVAFRTMGVGQFCMLNGQTEFELRGKYDASAYIPDEIINPHPRFWTRTQNIWPQRQRNVNTMVRLWKDEKTDVTPEPEAPNGQHSYPGRCEQARRAGCKDSSQ